MGFVAKNKRVIRFNLGRRRRVCLRAGEKTKGLQVPNQGAKGHRLGGDGVDLSPLCPDSLNQVTNCVLQSFGGRGYLAAIKEEIVELKLDLQSLPPSILVFTIPDDRILLAELKSRMGMENRSRTVLPLECS